MDDNTRASPPELPSTGYKLRSNGYTIRSLDVDEHISLFCVSIGVLWLLWSLSLMALIEFCGLSIVALLLYTKFRTTEVAITNKRFIYKPAWPR